jgi:hypothetical protein
MFTTSKKTPIPNSKRNMALAVACCAMLISCIDNMIENRLIRHSLKFVAKRFLDELLKITNSVFLDGRDDLAGGSFDETTANMEVIQAVFSEIPKKSNEEINQFLQ